MSEQERLRELDELVGEYVLGTLVGDERLLFEQKIRVDSIAADAVQAWENRLAPLQNSVEERTPSSAVWRGIEQRLGFVEDKVEQSFWSSLRLWQGVSAFATAMGFVLAVVLLNTTTFNPQMLYVVQDQQNTNWIVRASQQQSVVAIEVVNPPQLSEGKVCQLWITTPDGTVHSMGVLPHNGSINFPLIKAQQLLSSDAELSVTIENSATQYKNSPSGKIVSQGRWIQI